MNAKMTCSILCLCLTVAVIGQQPNSANHSMTINGVDGTPFPILTNVRTSLPATFTYAGLPIQPYALFQGVLHAGTTFVANGVVDLLLNPFPVLVLDGFKSPAFRTDASGTSAFQVMVPNAGTPPNGVPLGLQLGLQSVMGDPFNSPFGVSLTAATRITVTQGPTIAFYTMGDDSAQSLNMASMPIPFYGTNYTTIYMNSNGYLCFGASDGSDFTPTAATFSSGPPRMAAFWCDLFCNSNGVRTTQDTNPGGTGSGVPGYLKIDYIDVIDLGTTIPHQFSVLLQTDGYLEITSGAANNASVYDQITGIGPGGLGTQPQKNFVGAQPPGSSVGPGILTTSPFAYSGGVNETFFEWFGQLPPVNPNYANSYPNQFDIFGLTLHFLPTGSGSLPGSTNRYTLY